MDGARLLAGGLLFLGVAAALLAISRLETYHSRRKDEAHVPSDRKL